MGRLVSPVYALCLFVTAYLGFWRHNWLEKQFVSGRFDRAFRDQRLSLDAPKRPKDRLIWVHVEGEEAALGISEFLLRLEGAELGQVLLTSTEDLPEHFLEKRIPKSVFYTRVPLGTRQVVRRFLEQWSPDLVIWASGRLHFRVLHEIGRAKITSIWADLRVSYSRRRSWLLVLNYYQSLIRQFDLILCQDRLSRKLLRSLGTGRQKIQVTGSLVGGAAIPEDQADRRKIWTDALKDRQIWFASHVPPGELNTVYDAFARARRKAHRLLLVLQTSSARPDGLRGDQFYIADNPDPKNYEREWDVLIVPREDRGMWYRIAPVTYLGGNLSDEDSHNPFPAAQLGSALLTGPRWTRYRDLYDRLDQRHALDVVAGAQSLARAVVVTLSPDRAAMLAHAAWDVSTEGAQAADKAVGYVVGLLEKQEARDAAA